MREISIDITEEHDKRSEKVVSKQIDSIFKTSSALLPQGKRETGWLAFGGILSVTKSEIGPFSFGVTIVDTLGGEHGPIDVAVGLEERMVM